MTLTAYNGTKEFKPFCTDIPYAQLTDPGYLRVNTGIGNNQYFQYAYWHGSEKFDELLALAENPDPEHIKPAYCTIGYGFTFPTHNQSEALVTVEYNGPFPQIADALVKTIRVQP